MTGEAARPDIYSDQHVADVLAAAKSFAVVGASANPVRPSYFVMKYLLAKGYQVVPVNPGQAGGKILGQTVAGTLADISQPMDVIDIFRNSQAALEITRQAIQLKDRLQIKVIWMQLGVMNLDAAKEAEAQGLTVIMNRCPKIEYGRLSGEVGWSGINSGRVTSKRPRLAAKGVQDRRLGD